ncbi:hypothetical protein ACN28G_14690 [Micromonospora sp. WMMA1923]|uniref:hypothetical protein n=1 Tax=Micromonospora sp. WMMA1923 TaxID=3404125 RepID=UPI003B952633
MEKYVTSIRKTHGRRLRLPRPGGGVGAVLLAAGLTACAPTAPTTPPAAAGTSAASSPTASAVPLPSVTYRRVGKLCDVLDLTALRQEYGTVSDRRSQFRRAGTGTTMMCAVTLGRLPDGAVVNVLVTVDGPRSGQRMYEGLRAVQQETGPVTDVTGVGAAAYTYTDELTGTHVVTYDNNLYLSIVAAPLRLETALPDGVVDRLARTAAGALDRLRS